MDAQLVRELFAYDPETGLLRWRVNISKHKAGAVAGTRSSRGYLSVRYKGRHYLAHRLAFLWMEGRWPEPQIDHRNKNMADNRWGNLREATASQNAANKSMLPANKEGAKGVVKVTRFGVAKFEARIRVDGKQLHLGRFDTRQEAHAAYCNAAEKHFGVFARTL